MGSILSALEEVWHIIVIVVIACVACACCMAICFVCEGIPIWSAHKKKKALKIQFQNASSALGKSGGARNSGEVWNSTGYDAEEKDRQRMNDYVSIAANAGKVATGTSFL